MSVCPLTFRVGHFDLSDHIFGRCGGGGWVDQEGGSSHTQGEGSPLKANQSQAQGDAQRPYMG